MGRFVAWIGANVEALTALLLAGTVSVVGVFGTAPEPVVQSATLAVLALIGFSVVRDRWRTEMTEREVRAGLVAADQALRTLASHFDTMEVATQRAIDEMAATRVLNGPEVGKALASARQRTDRWVFKGGTGTYIRAVTLPECVESARQERRALLVRLEILDPTNTQICAKYARLRQSMSRDPDGTGEVWTTERTQKEAFATILAACWYRNRYALLDIELGLSLTMPTIRFDLSSRSLIITQDDPKAPALMFLSGRFVYDLFSTELRTSLEQARRVPLELVVGIPLADQPTPADVREVFRMLDLPLPEEFGDQAVAEIVQKAIAARNPYTW